MLKQNKHDTNFNPQTTPKLTKNTERRWIFQYNMKKYNTYISVNGLEKGETKLTPILVSVNFRNEQKKK
jgi:hypothetical protein